MTANEYSDQINFEKGLQVGSNVIVNWTNNNRYYSAAGVVAKINAKSIRVAINDPITVGGKLYYEAGREIIAPLLSGGITLKWSFNNCVRPITEIAIFAISRRGGDVRR